MKRVMNFKTKPILSIYTIGLIFSLAHVKTNEEFDFDGLPGVTYEMKFEVQAGHDMCFHQKIRKDARIFISYEVLRGGDRLIDFMFKDPQLNVLILHKDEVDGRVERVADIEGTYMLCVDNTASISRYFYGTKLVFFYLSTYVPENWEQYLNEIEGLHLTVSNFSTSISAVQHSIEGVNGHQVQSRMTVIKDWYLITGINKYIVWWSCLQIVIILITSCFQVYFVRRLFRIPNIPQNSKHQSS